MKRVLVLTVAVVLGFSSGCKKTPPPTATPAVSKYTQDAVAAGGTLNSDGSVTNANGTVTEPDGRIVPANQAATSSNPPQPSMPSVPATGAPAPPAPGSPQAAGQNSQTPAPAPVVYTAPAGTAVTIRTTEQLSASHNEVGDRFHAVLERPVISHGHTIFERGTPVEGTVVASRGKGRFKGAGALGIELTSIGREHVSTSEYEQENKGRGKRTAAFAGGGGGLGAIIGGLAGGGKGALIGGLAGAGGGAAADAFTGSRDVIIRPESVITFRLREAVSH